MNIGIIYNSVIVRDHNNQLLVKLINEWWDLYNILPTKRDRLFLPIVLDQNNISVNIIAN